MAPLAIPVLASHRCSVQGVECGAQDRASFLRHGDDQHDLSHFGAALGMTGAGAPASAKETPTSSPPEGRPYPAAAGRRPSCSTGRRLAGCATGRRPLVAFSGSRLRQSNQPMHG